MIIISYVFIRNVLLGHTLCYILHLRKRSNESEAMTLLKCKLAVGYYRSSLNLFMLSVVINYYTLILFINISRFKIGYEEEGWYSR
jgi:hypothetical protein